MLALLWETTSIVQRVQCASGREFERQTNGMVMVGYGIHGVRGTLVLVVLGHSESRHACVDDIQYADVEKRGTRAKKRREEGREKMWDPSVVLAYAICYRLDDALTRVQNPIFVLARIIPC